MGNYCLRTGLPLIKKNRAVNQSPRKQTGANCACNVSPHKHVYLSPGAEWRAKTEMGTAATRLLAHAPSLPFLDPSLHEFFYLSLR